MPEDALTRSEIEREKVVLEKCIKEVLSMRKLPPICAFLITCFTEKRLSGNDDALSAHELGLKVLAKGPQHFRGPLPVTQKDISKLEAKARNWIRRSRNALRIFYETKEGKQAPFTIGFADGPYRADFYRRITEAKEFQGNMTMHVDCHYVGNQVAGVRFVISQLTDEKVSFVQDTHIRPEGQSEPYQAALMRDLKEALLELCKSGSFYGFHILVGPTLEANFVNALSDVEKEYGRLWQTRQLREPGSSMNFTILRYAADANRLDEVLFGWGRHNIEADHVFRSSDPRLVKEFSRLFDSMWVPERSDSTTLEGAQHKERPIGNTEFLEKEETAPSDSEIWIASPDLANLDLKAGKFADNVKNAIRRNLERGIQYHYIYPINEPGEGLLRDLRELFGSKRETNLHEHPVTAAQFEELMPLRSYVISIGDDKNPTIYLQFPQIGPRWIILDMKTSRRVLQRMKVLAQVTQDKDIPAPKKKKRR